MGCVVKQSCPDVFLQSCVSCEVSFLSITPLSGIFFEPFAVLFVIYLYRKSVFFLVFLLITTRPRSSYVVPLIFFSFL